MRINQFLRVLVLILSPLFSFAQTDLKDFGKFLYQKNSKVTTINLDSVFQLNFSKYVKMETFNLEGVHLIKDFKIVLKIDSIDSLELLKCNVKFGTSFLFRNNLQESDPSNPDYISTINSRDLIPEKVGYRFNVIKTINQEFLNDTLILFASTNHDIYGFLISDYKKSAENILIAEQLQQNSIDKKNTLLFLNGIKGFEKQLFPSDSLYIVGVNYLIERSMDDFGRSLSADDSLFSKGFVLSSMKDLKQIKKNINIANAAKSNTWNYWSVDTVWIEKAIHFNQLGNLNSAISFFATGEKDVNFDTNFAMEEAKKDKKRLKVYTTLDLLKNEIPDIFVDKSEFLIRFSNNNGKIGLDIAEKLYGKRIDDRTNEEYKWKSYMVTTNILFKRIDDYNIELNDNKYDIRVDEPTYFSLINLDFTDRGDGRQSSKMVLDLAKSTGRFIRSSKYGYGLKPIEVKKIMAYNPCRSFIREMDILLEDQQNEAEKQKLINQYAIKYGKNFVQQAFDGNVIVGMHEDLLPVALKMWKLSRRTLVTGGQNMYLYSPIDTSIHVLIKVLNKKVTYVGTW